MARALGDRSSRLLLLDEIAGGPDRGRVSGAGRNDPRPFMPAAPSIVWIEHIVHALLAGGRRG